MKKFMFTMLIALSTLQTPAYHLADEIEAIRKDSCNIALAANKEHLCEGCVKNEACATENKKNPGYTSKIIQTYREFFHKTLVWAGENPNLYNWSLWGPINNNESHPAPISALIGSTGDELRELAYIVNSSHTCSECINLPSYKRSNSNPEPTKEGQDWNNFNFSAYHPASTETYRNTALYCTEIYNRIKPTTSAKDTLQELVKPKLNAEITDEHASTSPLIQDKL